jgi:hypothetical protein
LGIEGVEVGSCRNGCWDALAGSEVVTVV